MQKKRFIHKKMGQLWTSLQLKYKISKKFEFVVGEELRYYKYSSILDQSLSDIGMNYKISEMLKLGIFYRFRYYSDEIDRRHEIYTNLTIKPNLGDFEISNRSRLHIKFRENQESINNFRNLTKVGYKIFPWMKPFISTEIFYRFFDSEGDRITQGRYAIGFSFDLSDYGEFELFFMREQEYNNNKAIHSNIMGIGYTFNLE